MLIAQTSNVDFRDTKTVDKMVNELSSISGQVDEMQSEANMFSENEQGKTAVDNKQAQLEAEYEALYGEYLAEQQKAEKAYERKVESRKSELKSDYNPEIHGEDIDAYIEDAIASDSSLRDGPEVSSVLRSRLDIAASKRNEMGQSMKQSNSTTTVYDSAKLCMQQDYGLSSIDILV